MTIIFRKNNFLFKLSLVKFENHHFTHVNLRNLLQSVKKILASVALFSTCLVASAGTELQYLEKPIGNRIVRLPQMSGFASACEQDKQFEQKAALHTPKTSLFVTCFVDKNKWHEYKSGKKTDLYPLIAVTIVISPPGGDFTIEEFNKIKSIAYAQFGDLLANSESGQNQIDERDRNLSKAMGKNISTKNYKQELKGFFEPPGATSSFSFLVSRTSTNSEVGEVWEISASSTIFYFGKLLNLSVIDHAPEDQKGIKAQEITAKWLQEFRFLNKGAKK